MLNNELKYHHKYDFKKIYYNYFFLNKKEISLLEKFKSNKIQLNIETLFLLDENDLIQKGLLRNVACDVFSDLKKKTLNELKKSNTGHLKLGINERNFFVSSEIRFFDLNEIDRVLIEDMEDYLLMMDDIRQDVALSRWGFSHEKQTLEDVAFRHNLTRERIRQIEYKINYNLTNYLRIHPRVLWQHIREKMTGNLISFLPNLSRCFESAKDFYTFIELCCIGQVESGGLLKIVDPHVSPKLLNSYFSNNTSPVCYDSLIQELVSSFGYSSLLAITSLRELDKLGVVKITKDGIFPANLGKKEAVAHALTEHPNGLPWKDIAKLVNMGGYCSTKLNEDRLIHNYFCNSEYVYACGRGTYRHLMYLDISKYDITQIMKKIYEYFRSNNIIRLHLHDYYYQSNLSQIIEYFSLRYIIRKFGYEYGIYFNGKSGVDSLSLDPDASCVTQKEVVLQAFNNAKGAMTKQEIADRLRSKSLNHANYYLDQMIEDGSIIRIDYMTYTTPEKAFNGINVDEIIQLIKSIIDETTKIIEVDFFRLKINLELNLSYSKYFYSALISKVKNQYHWFKYNNLICKNEFLYKNLTDIFRRNFNQHLSEDENIKKIKEIILITDIVMERMLYNWKNNHLSSIDY